jgi:NAD-dependent deacetylase
MNDEALDRAAHGLADAERVLVVTGAGVSAESGIPTFRGAGGLWEGFRAEDLATPGAFAEDPARVWRWYRWRRGICLAADPNPAHRTVAAMDEAFPEFLLATQNVDGLHPRAGSRRIVELHGNIHTGRCTGCGRIAPLPDEVGPEDAPPPACADCHAMLRPHIVWFGESYWPGVLEEAFAFAERADAVLVAGTSAMIYAPIAVAFRAAERGAVLIDVNPDRTEVSVRADAHLEGPAGEVLPVLWETVGDLRS